MRRLAVALCVVACNQASAPVPATPAEKHEVAGRIVFSTTPIPTDAPAPASRTHFAVGEPIYGAVFLREPMVATRGPDRTGEVRVSLTHGESDGDRTEACGGNTLRGDTQTSEAILTARAFSVDAVRSPFPTRVRAPDIDYDPSCFDAYESYALQKKSMQIHVQVSVTTFDGRVTTPLAEETIYIDASDNPAPRLVALRRTFADEATMRKSDNADLERGALDAIRRYMHDSDGSFDPLAVAVHASGYEADVALRRPDGTCFVQPGVELSPNPMKVRRWPERYRTNVSPPPPRAYDITCQAPSLPPSTWGAISTVSAAGRR